MENDVMQLLFLGFFCLSMFSFLVTVTPLQKRVQEKTSRVNEN